jgi:hypothetical protein
MDNEPEFVSAARLDFVGALFASGSLQLFANFGSFGKVLSRFGHHD